MYTHVSSSLWDQDGEDGEGDDEEDNEMDDGPEYMMRDCDPLSQQNRAICPPLNGTLLVGLCPGTVAGDPLGTQFYLKEPLVTQV